MINRNKINDMLCKGKSDKENHFDVICHFLDYLNSRSSDFILKGGTSLMVCYQLDRFSEDIDLDSTNKNIERFINDFCKENGYQVRKAKDTTTTKRYMIHYSDEHKPLKIEISYRQKRIDSARVTHINGVTVYRINELFGMKINAYNSRDKIRDLYDVVFITKHYIDDISDERIEVFKDILSYKGLEQFDYLIKTQKDELIDNDKLATDFLEVFDKLELLDDYELENNISLEKENDLADDFEDREL